MRATKERQGSVIEALNSERQSIDACRGQIREPGSLDGIGVRLKSDLEIVNGCPVTHSGRNNRLYGRGLHQGRRAAAEENGTQAASRQQSGLMIKIRQKRLAPR